LERRKSAKAVWPLTVAMARAVSPLALRLLVEMPLSKRAWASNVAFDGGEHEQRPAVVIFELRVEAGGECGAEAGLVVAFDEGLGGAVGDGHWWLRSC
jgi:hypothetical protein